MTATETPSTPSLDRRGRRSPGATRGPGHRRRVRRGFCRGPAGLGGRPGRRPHRGHQFGPTSAEPASGSWSAIPPVSPTRPTFRNEGLLSAAEAASGAARGGGGGAREVALSRSAPASPSPVEVLPAERRPRPTRSTCCAGPTPPPAPREAPVRQVNANYRDSRRQVLVANSEGVLASDDQVRVPFRCHRRRQWRHRDADGRRGSRGDHGLRDVRPPRRRRPGPLSGRPRPAQAEGAAGALGDDACGDQGGQRGGPVP